MPPLNFPGRKKLPFPLNFLGSLLLVLCCWFFVVGYLLFAVGSWLLDWIIPQQQPTTGCRGNNYQLSIINYTPTNNQRIPTQQPTNNNQQPTTNNQQPKNYEFTKIFTQPFRQ
jgi:hypothetical protein